MPDGEHRPAETTGAIPPGEPPVSFGADSQVGFKQRDEGLNNGAFHLRPLGVGAVHTLGVDTVIENIWGNKNDITNGAGGTRFKFGGKLLKP